MVKEMKRKAAYNDGWASKARNAEHRLERFEDASRRRRRRPCRTCGCAIDGGRTGKVAFRARGLAIAGIVAPFDAEFRFGERIGVDRPERHRQDHFLRLLAGEDDPRTTASGCSARGSTRRCSRSCTSAPTSATSRSSRSS